MEEGPAFTFVIFVAIAIAIVLAFAGLADAWLSTGPNCPGMDPAWIGYCNQGDHQ